MFFGVNTGCVTGCVTLLFGFQRLAGGAAVCHVGHDAAGNFLKSVRNEGIQHRDTNCQTRSRILNCNLARGKAGQPFSIFSKAFWPAHVAVEFDTVSLR